MAKRYYTLDPHKYDFDEIFGIEAREAETTLSCNRSMTRT